MFNLFKSTETIELKEAFIIGDHSFTIDKSISTIEVVKDKLIELTLKTSESEFEKLSESESFEFSWALYAPMFYAREINLNKKGRITITHENKFDHEVALYFMEHCDVNATIQVNEKVIIVEGTVEIAGKNYPLKIQVTL